MAQPAGAFAPTCCRPVRLLVHPTMRSPARCFTPEATRSNCSRTSGPFAEDWFPASNLTAVICARRMDRYLHEQWSQAEQSTKIGLHETPCSSHPHPLDQSGTWSHLGERNSSSGDRSHVPKSSADLALVFPPANCRLELARRGLLDRFKRRPVPKPTSREPNEAASDAPELHARGRERSPEGSCAEVAEPVTMKRPPGAVARTGMKRPLSPSGPRRSTREGSLGDAPSSQRYR